ncbi:uncharacterized protein LOC126802817 [Argentina anserina]|uniref:uncharacterized protein LOC126802817 n=1 Tax=Argentina anserina TaxID=57926 RepID=UPI002176925F|nr:uncharacterized protein LOC126802817 [Potentilla anserina]XP_050386482.1 uncharacterized protein LOC126802817 [Potentilla anserina]
MEDSSSDNTTPIQTKDYYRILEVDYDATDENIRLNYRRLALKWHPDKHNGGSHVTAKFQEINEAYEVLSDPAKRLDYDLTGICEIEKYTLPEYLGRFRGMILTCNGLGISHASTWSQELVETDGLAEKSAL